MCLFAGLTLGLSYYVNWRQQQLEREARKRDPSARVISSSISGESLLMILCDLSILI
jgi:hypothetical protein